MSGPDMYFDFTDPASRAEAEVFLVGLNQELDEVVESVLRTLVVGDAQDLDRTHSAIALIANMQNLQGARYLRILALALHRLAVAQMEAPDSSTFNAHLLPTGECEVRVMLPPGKIAAGDPPWVHLRYIAQAIRAQADNVEREANPAVREHGASRILAHCANCGQPITPLTGYQFGDRGPTHITCPGKENQP